MKIEENEIFTLLIKRLQNIKKYKGHTRFKKRKRFLRSLRPFQYKKLTFGTIYFSHKRRNSFICLTANHNFSQAHLLFKVSSGLQGYRGPKRRTFQARLSNAKRIKKELRKNDITHIDLVFAKYFRKQRKFVKIIRKRLFIRYMILKRRRSHTLLRLKKERRK